jgi:SAM-dependent methyltransferase
VPLVLELLSPRSVVDVGCGLGAWLVAAIEQGITDVQGIDGPHVDVARLLIPRERFIAADLERPVELGRRYDLVISLEVAEHVSASAADTFVASLVKLGPAVLFSAAIPDQGGERHVNEQWPHYWVEKFAVHGYAALDCIRDRIWDHPDVEPWYAQNVFLYVSGALLSSTPKLQAEAARCTFACRPLVHPRLWAAKAWKARGLDAVEHLLDAVPLGCTLALADECCLSNAVLKPWIVRRLGEREGIYWGSPANDESVLAELEALRRDGVEYLVFAWAAFWWFERYARFGEYAREKLQRLVENETVVVFDLKRVSPRPDR